MRSDHGMRVNVAEPSSAVCPTLDGPVLTVLAGTTRPLSGREVARLVRRGSWPGVRRSLHRLVEHGLVHVQEAGSSLLYTLNRQHVAAPAVEILAGLRQEVVVRLRRQLGSWALAPVHASLFGSVARGDGGTASDVDLFIVRSRRRTEGDATWRDQVDTLAADVQGWTGNRAEIVELAQQELVRLRRDRPPIVAELLADAVLLAGRPLERLFGRSG